MRKLIANILLLLILSFTQKGISQQKIEGQYFVKADTLFIRWVPADELSWTKICKAGFDIYRIPWNNTDLPDSNAFAGSSPFNETPIATLPETNIKWDEITKQTEEALFVKHILYDKNYSTKKKNIRDLTYGLCLLSADFYPELAKAMGLSYKLSIPPTGKFAYMVKPRMKAKVTPYIFVCNYEDKGKLADINTLSLNERKGFVKLSWQFKEIEKSYSGYFIERSDNGTDFNRINKKPYVIITTETDKNKTSCTYVDSTAKPGIEYTYRIYGLSFFGFKGKPSNEVKVKVIEPIQSTLLPDSSKPIGPSRVNVYGHFRFAMDKNSLTKITLLKGDSVNGKFNSIAEMNFNGLDKFSMVDNTAMTNAYYKYCLYNNSGDSLISSSILFIMPDTTRPNKPTGLKGNIDSAGRVSLSWSPNNDKDLKGYRVFKANNTAEGFVDIKNNILKENACFDSVYLNTLTEEIYYTIAAVDNSYNISLFSDTIKLMRPDKIKPQEAICKSIIHNDSAIVMQWIPSASSDVEKYILYRKRLDGEKEKVKEFTKGDTLNFIDTSLEYDQYHQYEMQTIDDAGNISSSLSPKHYYTSRIRKPITDITYKVDKEKRSIQLNWKYPPSEIDSYVIYKAKKGEQMRIYKTVSASTQSLTDKEIYIGNSYVYRIKANYTSGAESKISKDVEIEF